MLAAMFSGDYNIKHDKDGRYFIDADGDTFVHVLNYLRYGELPPVEMATVVYRDATYFGLHGLVEELERYPSMLSKIQRDSYRNQFPGYHAAVRQIVDCISQPSDTKKHQDTTSDVVIVLFSQKKQPKFPNYEVDHDCFYKPKNKDIITANVTLGPWTSATPEKDVMNCIAFDLKEKGFLMTNETVGQCNYLCEKPNDFPGRKMIEMCTNSLYKLTFHWWRM